MITFQQNLPKKFPQDWPFLAEFELKLLQNSFKIGCFFYEFVSENPAKNLTFLHDLSEALLLSCMLHFMHVCHEVGKEKHGREE